MSVATQNPADPIDRFWCHSCDHEVVVDMTQYACSECNGGFIEHMGEDFLEMRRDEEEQERQAQQQAQQAQAQAPTPFNPFQQLDREQEQPFAVHRDQDDPLSFMVRSMLGHVQAQPHSPAPAPAPAQAHPYGFPPGGPRPRQPVVRPVMLPGNLLAAMTMPNGAGGPMLPGGVALFGGMPPGFAFPGGGPEDPFANRVTGLLEMLTGMGGMGPMGGAMFGIPGGLPGDIRDYAWGPGGLDHIITRLMDQMQGGAPPAPTHVIENLPEMAVTEEYLGGDKKECAVCMDAWTAGDVGKKLPCDHLFHNDCIVPWLQAHGTCPVCRLKLYDQSGQHEEMGPRRAR